jgi:hypothetical protein
MDQKNDIVNDRAALSLKELAKYDQQPRWTLRCISPTCSKRDEVVAVACS